MDDHRRRQGSGEDGTTRGATGAAVGLYPPPRPAFNPRLTSALLLKRLAGRRTLARPGAGSRENLFDVLRLLAALAVLVSHSFAIAGSPQPGVGGQDLGTIGVIVFFGISGFLIAQSWSIDPSVGRYLAKRALRILPALVMVLLLTTLVVGAVSTSLPAGEYLTRAGTWLYLFQNAALIPLDALPGVFEEVPDPRVNASLWTLQIEALAYLGLLAVGLLGGLRGRRWLPFAVTAVVFALPHAVDALAGSAQLFVARGFCVGTCLYLLRDVVPWHWAIAGAALLAWALAPPTVQFLVAPMVIPYATILVAFRGPAVLRRFTARGDFSYGIYLYAWPVGQVLTVLWGPSITPAAVIAISLPVTYALAVLSWNLVELPALAFKKHLRGRTAEPRFHKTALPTPTPLLQKAQT
jgi:peptidoglycan/LPS O-acetylase OafA/YrhL